MNNINERQPWSKNQISSTKPNIPRSESILVGTLANSLNGGHNKAIAYKKVMAGEKHKSYNVSLNVKILTPKTPPYQKLRMTIRAYFVPNSRVWENAEKYTAQKGGASEIKIKEIPNTKGKNLPALQAPNDQQWTSIQNVTTWRDNAYSSYIARIAPFYQDGLDQSTEITVPMPAISILKMRGRKAIYNDFERNKELDREITEYKEDTVSTQEWNSYFLMNSSNSEAIEIERARKATSYYTDVRMELQGFETQQPEMSADVSLLNWAQWEAKIAEARSEAENAQLNDWDIIAKIRGSKKLTEGKVQLIGEKTYTLNYSAVTQTSYSANTQISTNFQSMGTQGAYSYTEINDEIYGGMIFNEEGYVHIIATVYAETVYEKGIDRNELNITPFDEYRPDLKDEKKDVLYAREIESENTEEDEVIGFKRKYSELFKLPDVISGDMTTDNYFQINNSDLTEYEADVQLETNATYQLFEQGANIYRDRRIGRSYPIKWWKDYTDLLINKNLANKHEVYQVNQDEGTIIVDGAQQIFFVGKAFLVADLPVDEEIKNNYTKWGEH